MVNGNNNTISTNLYIFIIKNKTMDITPTTTPEEIGRYIKTNISSLSEMDIANLIESYDKTVKQR